ncbi:MAG: adenylate/guanylate cyclase domain-containing protein [Burkholderiaceae bacterium]
MTRGKGLGSRLVRALAGVGLVVLFAAIHGWPEAARPFGAMDRLIYDAGIKLVTAPRDDAVVIVDIDEHSLAREGRWPWDRARIAEMVRRLVDDGGARVVGFDVVFAERTRDPAADEVLASILRDRPVVLGYYFSSDRGGHVQGRLPRPAFSSNALPPGMTVASWNGYGANLPILMDAAAGVGFFNPALDVDGIVRTLPLMAEYRGQIYESLVLRMLRVYLGSATMTLDRDEMRVSGERGSVVLPVSRGLTALVPFAGQWRGPGDSFRYVSAAAVLAGEVDASVFKDRIVLIGASAPGLSDLRATPIAEAMPGVEVHATVLRGALSGSIGRRPAEAPALAGFAQLLVGLPLALIAPFMGALGVMLATSTALALLLAWCAWALVALGWVLPLSAGLAMVAAVGTFNLAVGYFSEGRARQAVVGLFGEYVSPALVEQMAKDPLNYRADQSQNRVLSIMFADIRGFTRMSETMEPQQLREYLNEFLTEMTEVIHRHRGTVDKYIGDAVMAFWGAPIDDARHADNAVGAAIEMQACARRLSMRFIERGLPPLAIGVGVNTGEVRVGDMGSTLRRAYTVIGDAVNLASRLESLTKHYELPIIVGEATVRSCNGHRFAPVDRVTVTGRVEPVSIFVPSEMMPPATGAEPSVKSEAESDEAARVGV